MFDIEMMMATGSGAVIEDYWRYFTDRKPGVCRQRHCSTICHNCLLFIDESLVTVLQIGGMFRGDLSRKATLAEYGF